MILFEQGARKSRPFVPDVSVTTKGRKKSAGRNGGAAVAEATRNGEPVLMRAFVEEEHREAFVEIYEATPEQRLVTCIEVLSPSNKRPNSAGWDLYVRKRQNLFLGDTNLVEIDLLRAGQRMPMLDAWPESPYTFLVAHARKHGSCRVWPVHFQTRVPSLPVPLAKRDPDITLDLQPMIESIYEGSRYDRSIDYRKPLDPPLNDEEIAWLKKQLRSKTST